MKQLILDYGFGIEGLGGRTFYNGRLIRFEPEFGSKKKGGRPKKDIAKTINHEPERGIKIISQTGYRRDESGYPDRNGEGNETIEP